MRNGIVRGHESTQTLGAVVCDLFGSTGIHEKEEVAKTSLFALHDLQDTTIPLEGMSADGWPPLPIELL